MNWSEYFIYNPNVPSGLIWKVNRYSGKNYGVMHIKAGDIAGNLVYDKNDMPLYVDVRFNRKCYKAGRIVWEMFYGEIPNGMYIDHLDGNPFNNRIENLDCKTPQGNSTNRRKPNNNSSGVMGVHILKTRTDERAMARWVDADGKRKSKSFSITTLGITEALRLAKEYRENKLKELEKFGIFYTERHGE